jgi:hypothetical protein
MERHGIPSGLSPLDDDPDVERWALHLGNAVRYSALVFDDRWDDHRMNVLIEPSDSEDEEAMKLVSQQLAKLVIRTHIFAETFGIDLKTEIAKEMEKDDNKLRSIE